MTTAVAPPFPYYGGKTRIAERIASALPPHSHYVEVFAGSLAVLLAKAPSTVETVNDLDHELMTFWRVLREQPEDLARACALTPHSRAEHRAALEPAADQLEVARRLWVRLSQGRMAKNVPTGWRQSAPRWSMARALDGYVDRFAVIAERLARVSLECRPALALIADYGRAEDVCLYVDPPYLRGTREGTGYRHEMAEPEQHAELLEALRSCAASVVLSGYASPLYDDVLSDWTRTEVRAHTTQAADSQRVEVLWSNRAPLGMLDVAL